VSAVLFELSQGIFAESVRTACLREPCPSVGLLWPRISAQNSSPCCSSDEVVDEGLGMKEGVTQDVESKDKNERKTALLYHRGALGKLMRGSGSRENNDGLYFIKQYKHIVGCIAKRNTCRAWRGRRSKTRFRKIKGNVFPECLLKPMSHADIICCAP
jgi:hypothetical protein